MSRVRCTRAHCGEIMEAVIGPLGHVTFVCAACERNKRRLCRDCPRPTTSRRALRCPACRKRRVRTLGRDRERAWYHAHHGRALAESRRYRAKPGVREARRCYMAAYRAAHPRDGLDRAYARAYMAQRRADPSYRHRQNARKRELRALRRLAKERAA